MTDTEKNEAVARKLGWTYNQHPYQYWIPGDLVARDKYGDRPSRVPDYCSDIKAAWEIVEQLKTSYHSLYVNCWNKRWTVWLADDIEYIHNQIAQPKAESDSAPMAIVDAFLKVS